MATKKAEELSAAQRLAQVIKGEPGRIIAQEELDAITEQAVVQAEPLLWILMNSGKFSSMVVDSGHVRAVTNAWIVLREFAQRHGLSAD